MTSKAIVVLLGLFFVRFAYASGGFGVGNGGGFAQCSNGYLYAYDYLISGASAKESASIAGTAERKLQQIAANLHRLQDPLANDFSDFQASLFQQKVGTKYQWSVRKEIPLVADPDVATALPANCKSRVQAIIFFEISGLSHVSYAYAAPLLDLVRKQPGGELQVAYLLVHEWLWNFFRKASFVQRAEFNRVLQSDRLQTMSAGEYERLRPR